MAVEIDANNVAHTQNGSSGRPNGYYYEYGILVFCGNHNDKQSFLVLHNIQVETV